MFLEANQLNENQEAEEEYFLKIPMKYKEEVGILELFNEMESTTIKEYASYSYKEETVKRNYMVQQIL